MSRPTEVWGTVAVPDVDARRRQLIIKVSFQDVAGFEARTMKFAPDSEIGQALVEIVSKCEIGKLADLFCLTRPGSNEMLPEDQTFQDLGIEGMSSLVFKPKPAEYRKAKEIVQAIDEAVRYNRKMFSLHKQGVAVIPAHIRALGMSTVYRIDVSYNKIKVLPPEIGFLTQLRELCLNFNVLETLPPEIGHLTSLEKLYVANNSLTRIPPEIGLCTLLKELNARENQLSSLPRSLGFLVMSFLDSLHVFGNPLHDTIPLSTLGEGHRAIARFLRNIPQSDAETPKLPELPHATKAPHPSKLKPITTESLAAPATKEDVASTTATTGANPAPTATANDQLLFRDMPVQQNEYYLLNAMSPRASGCLVTIMQKLIGHKHEQQIRTRAFVSLSFLVVRGMVDQVEKLVELLASLDVVALVDKLDQLPQPQLSAQPSSLSEAAAWTEALVVSRLL